MTSIEPKKTAKVVVLKKKGPAGKISRVAGFIGMKQAKLASAKKSAPQRLQKAEKKKQLSHDFKLVATKSPKSGFHLEMRSFANGLEIMTTEPNGYKRSGQSKTVAKRIMECRSVRVKIYYPNGGVRKDYCVSTNPESKQLVLVAKPLKKSGRYHLSLLSRNNKQLMSSEPNGWNSYGHTAKMITKITEAIVWNQYGFVFIDNTDLPLPSASRK